MAKSTPEQKKGKAYWIICGREHLTKSKKGGERRKPEELV